MCDVFDGANEVEADHASTGPAGGESFTREDDDVVMRPVRRMIDAVQTRDRSRVARMMPIVVLLRLTQERSGPNTYEDETPAGRWRNCS